MSAIPVSKSVVGTCYMHQDGSYLGKFKEIGRGQQYTEGPAAGNYRPIYVFQNRTIDDWPVEYVMTTSCKNGGKRKGTRKSRRNKRRNNKRRNNSRRV